MLKQPRRLPYRPGPGLPYRPRPPYQPGQALRHGAPCFKLAGARGREVTHVIGTKEDCLSCQRYRANLGVSLSQAKAIRAENDHSDPDHKCLACLCNRRRRRRR